MLATLIEDAKIGFTSYGNTGLRICSGEDLPRSKVKVIFKWGFTALRIYSSVDLPRSKVKVIFESPPELFHPPSWGRSAWRWLDRPPAPPLPPCKTSAATSVFVIFFFSCFIFNIFIRCWCWVLFKLTRSLYCFKAILYLFFHFIFLCFIPGWYSTWTGQLPVPLARLVCWKFHF